MALLNNLKIPIRRPIVGVYIRLASGNSCPAPAKAPEKPKCVPVEHKRIALSHREELKDVKRIMVKFGSAVIIEEPSRRIAMSRMANLIEQMADLHNAGKEILFITSGSVAHGRTQLSSRTKADEKLDKKPAAAVGQPGLMYLYNTMFSKFDIQCAQVLVTETDLYQDANRNILKDVLNKLLNLRVIPILNTNDAVLPQPEIPCPTLCKGINLRDNDTLAAMLSTEVNADLLIILSTVDGVYDKDPNDPNAKIMPSFSKKNKKEVEFGKSSNVGLGGMETKIDAALWAVDHGTSVVVANGMKSNVLKTVLSGKKFGTFFIKENPCEEDNTEKIAAEARAGNRALNLATADDRAACVNKIAEILDSKVPAIMAANRKDLEEAKKKGLSDVLIGRLTLTSSKIKALSVGLRQVAETSKTILGKVKIRTLLAEGLELTQITVPIGVILVIFEARPDVLPQIAALTIASGNGLVLKGGEEAQHSNKMMKSIVDEALKSIKCEGAVGLVSTREEIADLINLDQYIDLIIPRGGYKLIRFIQDNARRIPVMGHSADCCKVRKNNNIPLLESIRIVQFRNGSKSLFYKKSFSDEIFVEVDFLKKKFSIVFLERPFSVPLGINTSKKEKILSLCPAFLDERRKLFWKFLPTNDNAPDLCNTSER